MGSAQSPLGKRIEDYLFRELLPLWAERGWDRLHGGFFERLEADHSPSPLDYRRLTVCGRQLYVFSEAARQRPGTGHEDMAHRIYDYLVRRFWDDRFGGWFFTVALDGSPLDTAKDLYGHAFAMFGLAHYFQSFRRREALEIARETGRLLARHLRLPAGWFAARAAQDWSIAERSLEQNPHMHLLEAYVALARATEEPAYREEAAALAELFQRHLFDERSGILGEFFDERGRPHAERGNLVEPGHHFEWYWLIHEGSALWHDTRMRPAAERLFAWAERHGVDGERGGVFDTVDRQGHVVKESKRIWPQCERIKAYALRARAKLPRPELDAARARLAALVEFLFQHYLLADGGWREVLDRTLEPQVTALPGTTPYHLFLALSEALKALAA